MVRKKTNTRDGTSRVQPCFPTLKSIGLGKTQNPANLGKRISKYYYRGIMKLLAAYLTSPHHKLKMILTRLPIRSARKQLDASACLLCQWRSFTTTYRRWDQKKETPSPAPETPSVLDEAPRASGKRVESFTPKPLDRAIGLPHPPRAGENSGIDSRTLKQKRDDFVDWDKHLEKRKKL